MGLWLLLRAFASGCTAMTGVEAVSNAVSAFRAPSVKHAHRTLTGIVLLLAFLLLAIAMLAHDYAIGAMDQTKPGYQSVLSQLAAALAGRGVDLRRRHRQRAVRCCACPPTPASLVSRACAACSHATSTCRIRSPCPGGAWSIRSASCSWPRPPGVLLVAFGGITDRLIPLFAVGAFLSFTLSQAGMAMHWTTRAAPAGVAPRQVQRDSAVQVKRWINGAAASPPASRWRSSSLAKFVEGAWITILVIPLLFLADAGHPRRFDTVSSSCTMDRCATWQDQQPAGGDAADGKLERHHRQGAAFRHAACRMTCWRCTSPRWKGPRATRTNRRCAATGSATSPPQPGRPGVPEPKLVVLRSEYRQFLEPLLKIVRDLEQTFSDRPIAVLIPEVVKVKWWDYLLYTYRARQLQAAMVRSAGPRVVVIEVPWRIVEE